MAKETAKNLKDMTPEEVNDFLAEDSTDPVQLGMQKAELVKQIDELTVAKETLEDTIGTLTQEIEDLKGSQTEALTALEAELTDAKAQIAAAEEAHANTEKENNTLLDENKDLHIQLHKNLVDRVIDVKVALGKPGIEDREEALAAHIERTDESLNDSLVDLLDELQTKSQNIAAIMASAKPLDSQVLPNTQEENTEEITADGKPAQKATELTDADALKGLFGGRLIKK